jgi:hypothetical protein
MTIGSARVGVVPIKPAVIPGRRAGSGEPGIQTASPTAPQPGFRVRAKEGARPGMMGWTAPDGIIVPDWSL